MSPYVLKSEVVNIEDKNESLEQFDLHLFGHIGHSSLVLSERL